MRDVFILGGSKLQLDLIFEAKRLYFTVHLFDYNENCIGRKYADRFYHVDIKEKKKILAIAKEIKPVAVLTIATELGNLTSCYVSQELGLKSNSFEVAINTTNKKNMKNICGKANIKTASFQVLTNNKDIENWSTYPAIVKPYDSSAGRGVSYVENPDQIKEAINNALKYSNNNEVLLEEYIKGKQYSIETISSNGNHKIVTITEEYITPVPNIIETQQLVPARIDNTKKEKINQFALKVLEKFDITYGASHIEIKEDSNGNLYFIEIASRMGGWRSELINLSLGISYCQLLLFSVLDKSISFHSSRDDTAIVKMILSQKDFEEYKGYIKTDPNSLIEDIELKHIKDSVHLADSNGYYFIHIENKDDIKNFISDHC